MPVGRQAWAETALPATRHTERTGNMPSSKKELSLLHVFCIAAGAMISSGLFVLPGLAFGRTGPPVVVSYLIAGFLASLGMLSQAELVSAMPKAGGDYFYVTRSMGPALGTVDGLVTWLSLCLKSSFALVGAAAFAAPLLHIPVEQLETARTMALISLPLCLIFVAVNLLGIKQAGGLQVALVFGLLALLGVYIIKGLPEVKPEHFESFTDTKARAIFATAGFVFISYGGLLKVASVAEEVKNPGRTVPLGMILSLIMVSLLYLLVVLVTVGVLDASQLKKSYTPISDGAGVFLGDAGRIALSIAAVLAFVSTANAGIMSASRYPLAAGKDKLLPEFLTNTSKRFGTPYNAIFITGGVMALALFFKLPILVEMASCVLILTFIFSCLAVIMMRESRVQNYQPRFRSPLYPWVQIAGIAGYGFLLYEMGYEALLACAVPVALGFFVYWFYGRIRANREYALLHLVERITAAELTTRTLQTELKEIIRERDDIAKDRFDRIIEKSPVMDIVGRPSLEEFFQGAANAMAKDLGISNEKLFKDLMARERESTTTITPTLAIPHIVCEGSGCFDILLARCRGGIRFSDAAPNVHAVFVLVGSMDERNFHLRALAAIAQIVQDPNFEKRWLNARTNEDLRDLVLLGKRHRNRAE